MRKSPGLYILMLVIWSILSVAVIPVFVREFSYIETSGWQAVVTGILLFLNSIFILYFWLNGVKDVTYIIYYYTNRKRLHKFASPKIKRYYKHQTVRGVANPKITLVYCTCNDFGPAALEKCMKQTYQNLQTVILDDSDTPSYKRQIDKFAREHGLRVIRREDRTGFKAGNLNHYLKNNPEWGDYFVILDSDEIIPKNFCEQALLYFESYDNIGIVQGNHIATRNRTKFMKVFHVGVKSHWLTYQTTKAKCGFMSLLGHGAMVSRECFEAAGGIPEVVAEDLCFSIEARTRGYYTAFAPDIVCEEEYPVDYLAFKKRHNKWTSGNLEFIRKYTLKILRSKMHWYEKLDIFLFTYNLPLTAFFSFYIFINIMFLPMLGFVLHFPAWLLIPTVVFFLAPMSNDFISWFSRLTPIQLFKYMLMTFMLYGSMLFVSMKASLLGMLGAKAVFIVTPKSAQHITLKEAVRHNAGDIIFAVTIMTISYVFCGNILPVILIIVPAFMSIFLSMYTNEKVPARRTQMDSEPRSLMRIMSDDFNLRVAATSVSVLILGEAAIFAYVLLAL